MALKNNKSLGQHWLKNREILDEIARLALVEQSATSAAERTAITVPQCLEIGPGLGTLTSSLLRLFPEVIAVEFDERLATNLPKSFPGKNLRVINDDILKVDLSKIVTPPYVAVGNIPYYITSPIVKKLLEATPRPEKIVLLMQKEVAERIAAEPGDHSLLSLEVQNLAEVELGPVVPAEEFTPPPKVDSQVIVLTPLPEPQIDPACLELAKLGFSAPRKKLAANLAMNPGKARAVLENLAPATPSSSAPGAASDPAGAPATPATFPASKADWQAALAAKGNNPDARAQDLDLWDWENLSKS